MQFDHSNPKDLYRLASTLYREKNNKELAKLFSKHLKQSYDVELWSLYIEYVRKVSASTVNILDVFLFVLNHFEHSYERTRFVKDYIVELNNLEDDPLKVERIRKTYHRALSTPICDLPSLRSEYEMWETRTNKQSARSFIDQIHPAYLNAHSIYQKISEFLSNNQFYGVIDLELENPLRLSLKAYNSRLDYLFVYLKFVFPNEESIPFLHSFYLGEQAAHKWLTLSKPLSSFLSIWFSFLTKSNHFNFDDHNNYEIVLLNYLDWLIKNKGIEIFRNKFKELAGNKIRLDDDLINNSEELQGINPYLLIFAAEAEYKLGERKGLAYKLFAEATRVFPDNSIVVESFFDLFSGESDGVLHFKQIRKTARLWEEMGQYLARYGTVEEYKDLMLEWDRAEKRGEVLDAVRTNPRRVCRGSQGLYENALNSFRFYDLTFCKTDLLEELMKRLPELPYEENILRNVNVMKVVELLRTIN